jgi:hypothetical protein
MNIQYMAYYCYYMHAFNMHMGGQQEAWSLMETRWRERLETMALGLETMDR